MINIVSISENRDDSALGEPAPNYSIIDSRRVKIGDTIEPTHWLIKGIIPEGVGVISGSGGVGKTTSIAPLSLLVAGISSPACDLEVEIPRKVIYITEDDGQLLQTLHGMRIFLKWDDLTWQRVKQNFIVLTSERIDHISVRALLDETLIYGVVDPIFTMPLVVFDTASANFDLENESSNSEASLFMSTLKQFYNKYKASVWVISHLSKDSKGLDIDSMGRATSRGAGSWGDDAMWTSILGTAQEDGLGDRILKIGKVRATTLFNEISFQGSVQKTYGIDRLGNEVQIDYRYTVPRRSSQDERKTAEYIEKCQEIEQEILAVCRQIEYPSKKDIKENITARAATVNAIINNLLGTGSLEEVPFPPEMRRSGRSSYIAVKEDLSVF